MRRACASMPIPIRSSDASISMAFCLVSPTMVLWTPLLFYPFFPFREARAKGVATPTPPGVFCKNVNLNGLCVHMMQECESKGFTQEFRFGASEGAGAEVSPDNTRHVTTD